MLCEGLRESHTIPPTTKETATTMQKNNIVSIEEEARSMQREYLREYRRQHPEKVKAWNKAYWEKKAAARLQADGNRITENA